MREFETYILFMIAELIGVVVIRKMMCCFFDAPFKVQPMEYMGYILYYIFQGTPDFLWDVFPVLYGQRHTAQTSSGILSAIQSYPSMTNGNIRSPEFRR